MGTVENDTWFRLGQAQCPCSLTAAADHSGGMIALMPTPQDAERLALPGGEPQEELHLTLAYLGDGDTMDLWTPEQRAELADSVRMWMGGFSPVQGRVFGSAHWNTDTDTPSWVWSVGDGESDHSLSVLHALTLAALERGDFPTVPEQYNPWIPHICAVYSDDPSFLPLLEEKLGPVTFDRVRVSLGDQNTDIPLDGPGLTAAASPLRRNLNKAEIRAGTDFAKMDREWKRAVKDALSAIQPIRERQIKDLVSQVRRASSSGGLDALTRITLDSEDLQAALVPHLIQAAQDAAEEQQKEAEKQGVKVPDWSLKARSKTSLTAAVGVSLLRAVSRVTARLMSTALVQSAIRKAMSLVGRTALSADRVADEVRDHLNSLTDSGPREAISGAITAAQNEGRRTVLAAAPKASSYTSSEILDENSCQPCRQEDGTSYDTLDEVLQAYPSGGFKDCLGGTRCRGTYVAVWGE